MEKEMFHIENRVRFEWNMLYSCNYRCPYCFFEGKWEEYGKRTVFLSVEQWMGHWKRIYERYGSCALVITGGEPFVYPDFIQLIKEISAIHYPINISSNASGDLSKFVSVINPERVSVTLSFHPEYNTIEEIIKKKRFLELNGFRNEFINLCVYPPYTIRLKEYIETAHNSNETLKVIPFIGSYNGHQYPESYSLNEKELLGLDTTWKKNVERKGTLCAAGQKSALIFPDGKVARCGQIGERFLLGNIFDESFELLDAPMHCDAEMCPCLETITVEESSKGTV